MRGFKLNYEMGCPHKTMNKILRPRNQLSTTNLDWEGIVVLENMDWTGDWVSRDGGGTSGLMKESITHTCESRWQPWAGRGAPDEAAS